MEQDKKNHPGTAAVLSFIFNGLVVQLYNGQIIKGEKSRNKLVEIDAATTG